MMNRAHVFALALVFFALPAFAQNATLSYQGQLGIAAGQPVTASYPMTLPTPTERS